MRRRLPRHFYLRDPETVARELLGKFLLRRIDGEVLSGMITETEAYLKAEDSASHGARRRTAIRESLYAEGGCAYVYALRHHFLLNAVTEGVDEPSAVLIRAVDPREGREAMMHARGKDTLAHLADGPGKLCQAFRITTAEDGIDLVRGEDLWIEDRGVRVRAGEVRTTARIGITKNAAAPLRFVLILPR